MNEYEMKIYLKFLEDNGVKIKVDHGSYADQTMIYTIDGKSFKEHDMQKAEIVIKSAFQSIGKKIDDAIPHNPMRFNMDNLEQYIEFLKNNHVNIETYTGTAAHQTNGYAFNGQSFAEHDKFAAERVLMSAFQSIGKKFEDAERSPPRLRRG